MHMLPSNTRVGEGGFTLLETAICVALLSIALGGAMAALSGIAAVSEPDPAAIAAQRMMERMLALESAALKYTDPASVAIRPSPWRTTMPLAGGSSVPVTVLATLTTENGAPAITFSLMYPQGTASATLSRTVPLVQKAPPPQAVITAPGTYADPNATPTP